VSAQIKEGSFANQKFGMETGNNFYSDISLCVGGNEHTNCRTLNRQKVAAFLIQTKDNGFLCIAEGSCL
jgi:hypothetical protein